MYWSLNPSQAKRDLTNNDLKVLHDIDTGPEPLMAAPFAQGHAAATERSTPPEQTALPPVAGQQGIALLLISSPMVAMQFDSGIQAMQGAFASPVLVVGSGDNLEVGGIGIDNALGRATLGKESDSTVLVGGTGDDLLVGDKGINLMFGGFGVERFWNEQSTVSPAETSAPASSNQVEKASASDDDAGWAALGQERSDGTADLASFDEAVIDSFFAEADSVRAAAAE
jgi:Ca2+-binding RTX toxin-like protein